MTNYRYRTRSEYCAAAADGGDGGGHQVVAVVLSDAIFGDATLMGLIPHARRVASWEVRDEAELQPNESKSLSLSLSRR